MKKETTKKLKQNANKVAKKAGKVAKNTANVVAANPKEVLIFAGVILGGFLLYKAIQKINDASTAVDDLLNVDTTSGGGNVGNHTDPSSSNPGASINVTQAEVIAANLIGAMDSLGGLNEAEYNTVEQSLAGKNTFDYQLISNAFGTPWRSMLTGEEGIPYAFSQRQNLTQWLTVELNPEQKQRIKIAAPLIFPNF